MKILYLYRAIVEAATGFICDIVLTGKRAFHHYFEHRLFEFFSFFDTMENKDFNKNKLIEYWITGSDDDYETMIAMFKSKRYSWSLFIGHLMIEKLLKAYYVKVKSDYPPLIHNLLTLAE